MAETTLKFKLQAATKQFQTDLKIAKKSIKGIADQSKSLGKSLSKNISAPLALVGGIAIKQSMKFERLKTSLKVLTGSAEAGAVAFENLSKFSAKTPFQLDELAKANNMLMGFGLSASQSLESLKLLGDIAAVSGGDLNGITVAFGQAAAEGRLMTRDIMQLVNNGVPAYKLLAQEVGVSSAEIRKMASEGKISFDILVGALQNATAEGGMFANGMEVLSGTLGGVTSTLRDNLSIAFAELGNEIVKAFDLVNVGKKLTTFIQGAIESFKNLDDSTKKTIIIIGGIAAAIGPLLVVVGTVLVPLAKGFALVKTAVLLASSAFRTLSVAMLANPIGIIAAGLVLTVLALKEVAEYLNPAVSGFKTLFNAIKSGGNYSKFMALQSASIAEGLGKMNKETSELETKLDEFNSKMKTAGSSLADFGKSAQESNQNTRNLVSSVSELSRASGMLISSKNFSVGGVGQTGVGEHDTGLIKLPSVKPKGVSVIDDLKNKLKALAEQSKKTGELYEHDFTNSIVNGAMLIGDALANGQNVFAAFGSFVLSTLGDILIKLGSMSVAAGKLSAVFMTPAGIAAGIAAIAIGAAMKGVASKIQGGGVKAFANGGLVMSPTLGLIGEGRGTTRSNPEVVAPLDKLQGMIGDRSQNINVGGEFRVQGQDLVLALQRADRNRGRIK